MNENPFPFRHSTDVNRICHTAFVLVLHLACSMYFSMTLIVFPVLHRTRSSHEMNLWSCNARRWCTIVETTPSANDVRSSLSAPNENPPNWEHTNSWILSWLTINRTGMYTFCIHLSIQVWRDDNLITSKIYDWMIDWISWTNWIYVKWKYQPSGKRLAT